MRVAVVGAGAAGTMAAIFAAGAGAETILLERTADGGRKILISGGGRCNILPAWLDESRFVTDSSPHTLRNILRSWPLQAQIAFFEREIGVPLVEEPAAAKLFPRSQRARDVRDGLLTAARRNGVALRMGQRVTGFAPAASGWELTIQDNPPLHADALVIATGGLSVPATGSDGDGLRAAAALGHVVHEPYAALTPLTADPAPFASLSGVSLPVAVAARADTLKSQAAGGFLFTHRGYSGPAILDVSHVAVRSRPSQAQVEVSWTPLRVDEWTAQLTAPGSRTVVSILTAHMPSRLAGMLLTQLGIDARLMSAKLGRKDRLRLIEALTRFPLPWTGHEGYKKAEVTGGGVSLAEIDPRTMESRRNPGLFLCGEMLDAFGPIGGYNFLWAWVTGRAAGLGAADVVKSRV